MQSTSSSIDRTPFRAALGVAACLGLAATLVGCARGQIDTGVSGAGAGGSGGGGGAASGGVPAEPTDPVFLPARIRRLSNAEYDESVAALLGTTMRPGRAFASDARQSDFTLNVAQRVDPVYAAQLQDAAKMLAKDTLGRTLAELPCAQTAKDEACATDLITKWASRAFRRPVTGEERADLVALWKAGAKDPAGGTFEDGVELVMNGILQSASFLYVTEIGSGAPRNGTVTLSPHETASAMAFGFTGGPPDTDLLQAAADAKLSTTDQRRTQAQRLLALPGARTQVQRLIKEWLKLDALEQTGKNAAIYPRFDELRPHMAKETDDFIAEVVWNDDATIGRLLAADYTVAPSPLADFYGLGSPTGARMSTTSAHRRGLLAQGAFLSVHGKDIESAPVKRGVEVLKKILCADLPNPKELNIDIVPPAPDPRATTRERFTVHAKEPMCASCHNLIDPIGFAFEAFDGMGGARTSENGKPVDTSVDLKNHAEWGLDGHYADAAELMAKIATSPATVSCFARNLFRFASAQTAPGTEKKFIELYETLPDSQRASIRELLVAYAASDLFITRRQP